MTTKTTPFNAIDNVQTSAPPALPPVLAASLPPVPGGGSWRPNAAGDGWLENLPESPDPHISTSQSE
jgi:hypothetical protein